MFFKVLGAALGPLSAHLLDVECFISSGLPNFQIIGMSQSSASEAKERVRSALKSTGFSLPPSRITINIRPHGGPEKPVLTGLASLDLPIALSLLACAKELPFAALTGRVFAGELSLSGQLRPVLGALSLSKAAALLPSVSGFFLSSESAPEAALCKGMLTYGLDDLPSLLSALREGPLPPPVTPLFPSEEAPDSLFDAVYGQESGKRAIIVAASGYHNLLFIGPPGCGKTMLSRCVPSLLPPLTLPEQLELTEIYSRCGLLAPDAPLVTRRPFRAPHHTATMSSLIGGGTYPRPGEITLAHRGVLFLDELPEFPRSVVETLREPMEERRVHISRLQANLYYPAETLLIAAANGCPCGHYPDMSRCRCPPGRVAQYQSRLRGPLFDRMDLVLTLRAVPISQRQKTAEKTENNELSAPSSAKGAYTLESARKAVHRAHERQKERFQLEGRYNAHMTPKELTFFCRLSPSLQRFSEEAAERFQLSMRAYHKMLRLARTIADMEESPSIELMHLSEAISYRSRLDL